MTEYILKEKQFSRHWTSGNRGKGSLGNEQGRPEDCLELPGNRASGTLTAEFGLTKDFDPCVSCPCSCAHSRGTGQSRAGHATAAGRAAGLPAGPGRAFGGEAQQHNVEERALASGSPRLESQLLCLLAVWHRASDLTSLSLRFPSHEADATIVSIIRIVVMIK